MKPIDQMTPEELRRLWEVTWNKYQESAADGPPRRDMYIMLNRIMFEIMDRNDKA